MTLLRRCVPLVFALLAACDSTENSVQRTAVEMGRAEGCDASEQICLLARDGIELQLELDKNIRALQPFQLKLGVTGVQQTIDAVTVEFFMEGMEMGINRYRLLPTEKGWDGEITLPVCVAGRNDWRAVVEVTTRASLYRGAFRFHSSN